MADTTNIIIRESIIEDLDELEELMKRLTEVFRKTFFRDEWRLDMKYKYDVGGIFVAEDTIEKKIAGMILVDVGRDWRSNQIVAKVSNFIVDPQFQSKGIGSKLLDQAIEYSTARKAAVIRVNARRELKGPVQLFKKFGFEEIYMVMERELE